MPTRSQRRKERKFSRTPGGKTVTSFFKGKASKKTCALCELPLHGVAHGKRKNEVSKLSKSEKRPSRVFGGVLCASCCTEIVSEAVKVKAGIKKFEDVPFAQSKYVHMASGTVGG